MVSRAMFFMVGDEILAELSNGDKFTDYSPEARSEYNSSSPCTVKKKTISCAQSGSEYNASTQLVNKQTETNSEYNVGSIIDVERFSSLSKIDPSYGMDLKIKKEFTKKGKDT